MLLAIDPGEDLGWALFSRIALLNCGIEDCERLAFPIGRLVIERLVIECPYIYPKAGKANPNDMITLARKVGRIEERFDHVPIKQVVFPRTWKGTVPKEIHNRRVIAKLDAREVETLHAVKCTEKKLHNVIDAVGLGLWALGR